ncbi:MULTISPECIES: ABC transporter ATP-binding protein [unclassified Thermoactinomyces]|jgi:iron complex transport system ATP-binding protein|uniref:ABC transporter ATP-binding protein n=1 Tax=unclassified Thermoactinomyces TaxID=2634588 RepID=UPI0018DDA9E0|nr:MULTISPECIES: ABC transporter ATP-binding protein [unclassified Thermoactinomyces]MBH8599119.1 ABC transporter ATP-binding protein [Thermoactinomyces sp. CICC 10523]MBH8605758.1 ABC transporter ATP-binding protein [Thermoactinomyces sp. CICC 10522]MBH8607949.1 ABC transporter ATP-binding protein [Thermoactinomyces sp. CICC 10521]
MSRLYTENLSIAYGDEEIVKTLNLNIPDQKITAIIGPNGCGKSTLLKAMARILSPRSGAVFLDGKEMMKQSTKKIAQKMAILPQTLVAPEGITVAELVSYGRFPYQKGMGRLKDTDREVIDWALQVTGIADFRDRQVDALSGGQRQRVWIAVALAQETEIILLDEPTTYLDLSHQLEILELLKYLNEKEKRTIVMVIHDLNQAARFADHLVAMKKGRIIKEGTAQEVMTSEVIRSVFNIDVEIGLDPRTKKPMCLTYDLIKRFHSKEEMMI